MSGTQQHFRQLYRIARDLGTHIQRSGPQKYKSALRAELAGKWHRACELWFEQRALLIETNASHDKADQSLAYCALRCARNAENEKNWTAAIQAWDYLRAAEPGSDAAAKGIDRCANHVAAEIDCRGGDLALKYPLHFVPQNWKIDVLLRLGCSCAASDQLAALENELGKSVVSCKQRALIALHAGKFDEAAQAARTSLALLREAGQDQTSDLPHILADALCAQNLHADARTVLFENLPGSDALRDRDFAALFATARNRADLDAIRVFLEPAFLPGHRTRSGALKQYSIALYDLGIADESWEIARTRLLDSMSKPFGYLQRGANSDWSKGAEHALLDLKADLDAGGFRFFLISGTLLGAVREGRVLVHDKDLDVGVPADVDLEAIRAHLQTTGRFRIKWLPAQTMVRAIHANGTSIDIFRHWLEEGRMVHQGQKAQWHNTPFTLKPMSFLGETFQVPSDPELYLTENYGDWKTPAKDFDTVVDTPNMMMTDRDHLIWYCYTGLQNYYAWGSVSRFGKLWALLNSVTPADAELTAKIAGIAALREEEGLGA